MTVFKLHWGRLTLKIYDKGARVLRIEVIAHSVKALRCGKRLEKLPIVLAELQRMLIGFLTAVQAAHVATLEADALDALPQPTRRGAQRVAGVDIQKPRLRAVTAGVLALAFAPRNYRGRAGSQNPRASGPGMPPTRPATPPMICGAPRHGVGRARGHDRRYRPHPRHRTLAARFILREKVIKPVLAGAGRRSLAAPKRIDPLDTHYENLQRELRRTFDTLGLAA